MLSWVGIQNNVQPNTYRVEQDIPPIVKPLQSITFSSDSPLQPVPNPRYIAFHAACAQAAKMSGAGKYIYMLVNYMEQEEVDLVNGVSFPELLAHAIQSDADFRKEALQ